MTEEQAQEVIFNDLGFCGCGNPEIVLEFVHKALQLIKKRRDSNFNEETNAELDKHFRSAEDDLFHQIAWYFLDRGRLIEHGGNVCGSWLTDKGKEFLAYLDAHSPTEIFA